jgi:hypothetical protein
VKPTRHHKQRESELNYVRFREDFTEALAGLSDGAFRLWVEAATCAMWFGSDTVHPDITDRRREHLGELLAAGLMTAHGSPPRIAYGFPGHPTAGYMTRPDLRQKRTKLPAALVAEVLSSGECDYCSATTNLQVDHIIPWSLGGTNHIANLRPLCASCNASRGNRMGD